jgi:hypothetical protein
MFAPVRKTDKTCSFDCSIELRRKLTRERQARVYEVRPPRPDFVCIGCNRLAPTPRTGPQPKWCGSCRANQDDRRTLRRDATRKCYKCDSILPDVVSKPGRAVCEACRVDKRNQELAILKERRRTLRRYGLTPDAFDRILAEQDGRCRICGTDDPGGKGWCIDHCHQSQQVRALMCNGCNMALGFAREDPRILRALADFAEQWQRLSGEIKI